ncbi:MAG: class I SAM-dependent methyltransferase [Desulfomonile tiedjei]|nr:class I SAM-dependent methyltransferase [Desulfomonile tiedjei]
MSSPPDGAQRYFERIPEKWDVLYSDENPVRYAINRLFRKGLFERYRLTFEHCGDIAGASVLDIGCGTGRYSLEFAKRGASRVVGIDFAPSMVEFSRRISHELGLADRCEFVCGDFLTHPFGESFDIVSALGLFDYVADPAPLFAKMADLTNKRFLASFPRKTGLWDLQRTIRYRWIKKCPIYNYTREQLEERFRDAPFPAFRIIQLSRGFFGIGIKETEAFL